MYNAATPRLPQLRPRRMAGVSLIELMVVVAVVAILLGVGMSSYKSITVTSRVSGEINGLLGDMQYARSEAIKQGQNVVVCVSVNGTDCSVGNTQWNQGWIVFADPTNTRTTGGNAALVLRAQAAFPGATPDSLTDGATSNVSFDREGLALGLGTGAVLALHDPTTNTALTRCLAISNIGNVAVQQPSTLATCT
ncbi:MAG TPA: GspH/FimT family pseudopilin [Steroidobacteraceae bacterium]|nr:GspH/FimT family pseudopilin [Steroidobacteraceae bacterium]